MRVAKVRPARPGLKRATLTARPARTQSQPFWLGGSASPSAPGVLHFEGAADPAPLMAFLLSDDCAGAPDGVRAVDSRPPVAGVRYPHPAGPARRPTRAPKQPRWGATRAQLFDDLTNLDGLRATPDAPLLAGPGGDPHCGLFAVPRTGVRTCAGSPFGVSSALARVRGAATKTRAASEPRVATEARRAAAAALRFDRPCSREPLTRVPRPRRSSQTSSMRPLARPDEGAPRAGRVAKRSPGAVRADQPSRFPAAFAATPLTLRAANTAEARVRSMQDDQDSPVAHEPHQDRRRGHVLLVQQVPRSLHQGVYR